MRSSVIVPALLFSVIALSVACEAQKKSAFNANSGLLQTIQTNFEDGAKQYKVLKAANHTNEF
jgi:unsaturated chondroitin disaccharide hydrolase